MNESPTLEELDDCIEEGWYHFARTVTNATEEVLGLSERKNKDWFDENVADIRTLLNTKK